MYISSHSFAVSSSPSDVSSAPQFSDPSSSEVSAAPDKVVGTTNVSITGSGSAEVQAEKDGNAITSDTITQAITTVASCLNI